jgi:hypothetical protein
MNGDKENAPRDIRTPAATCEALLAGREYRVDPVAAGSRAISLSCTSVAQRIWSRVGIALNDAPGGGGTRYFLKQNIDRSGRAHPDHWLEEREGAELGFELLGAVATVPRPLFVRQDLLLNVFDFVEVASMDELLRGTPEQFERCFEPVLQGCAALLEQLGTVPGRARTSGLPRKVRPYDTGRSAVLFRGLEIRNLGPALHTDGSPDPGRLVVFDLGQASIGPLEDAGARLFVSIGLLNWGRPLNRFLRGPDPSLMRRAYRVLRPYSSPAAVRAELDLNIRLRQQEVLASDSIEHMLKRVGIGLIGRRYFQALSSWVEKHCD